MKENENSYNNNMSELDEEKVYHSLALVYCFGFSLFDWRLGVFAFSNSCVSGLCIYHDKE